MSREQEIALDVGIGTLGNYTTVTGKVIAYYSPTIDHDTGEIYGQLNWWRSEGPLTLVADGVTTLVEPADLPPPILEAAKWIIEASLN